MLTIRPYAKLNQYFLNNKGKTRKNVYIDPKTIIPDNRIMHVTFDEYW